MKTLILLTLAALALSGCATSTVESRKKERLASYAALAPELRESVDRGQLKVGMTMDAVYIAWGKPSQILTGESTGGTTVTWLYHDMAVQRMYHFSYAYGPWGRGYLMPYPVTDYYASPYVRAEAVFENGTVKSWRVLARQPK